jgi:hypothetical protein
MSFLLLVNKREATKNKTPKFPKTLKEKIFYVSSTMHEPIKIGSTSLKVHYTHKTKKV